MTIIDFAYDHPIGAGAIGLGTAVAVGAAIWGGSVLLSDIKGQGDATRQINSGTNRIDQYEHFVTLDKDIRSQSEAAAQAQTALDSFNKQFPASSTEGFQVTEQRANLQAAITGPRQLCLQNVNEYNNDAKAYTRAKFKDSNLPDSFPISACTDPANLPASFAN